MVEANSRYTRKPLARFDTDGNPILFAILKLWLQGHIERDEAERMMAVQRGLVTSPVAVLEQWESVR